MECATFRFHGDLPDFLPPERQGAPFERTFRGPVSVKHLVESLGVPHTEVGRIVVNGRPVDFSYLLQHGNEVHIYPVDCQGSAEARIRIRPELPLPPRFILDNHLGRLARYLRLLGFDTLYGNAYDDEELARLSHDEQRVLLSRDRGLLKRRLVVFGCCLRSRDPKEQLRRVIERYDLAPTIKPWRRCLRCNGLLRPVDKQAIIDRLEPKTKLYYDTFHICEACHQIYWKGSHFVHLQQFLNEVVPVEA